MKLVIDIPEGIYETICKNYSADIVRCAIKNGTPLDAIKSEITRYTDTHCNNGYILRESVFEILEQKGVKDEKQSNA